MKKLLLQPITFCVFLFFILFFLFPVFSQSTTPICSIQPQNNQQGITLPSALVPVYLPYGNGATAAALKLQSNPGATNCVYLDFDGDSIAWDFNVATNYIGSCNATNDQIRLMWQVITADFIAFDVNVTTDRAVYDAHPVTNKTICVFGPCYTGGLSGNGGISIFSFGSGKGAAIVNTKNVAIDVVVGGNVASHELGHNVGLNHHTGFTKYGEWEPIMSGGATYGNFAQWSKGEYSGADGQDDISIISSKLGFRKDDYIKKMNLNISSNDSLYGNANHGIIENQNDMDTFYFELTATTPIHLLIDPLVAYTDLDIEVDLYSDKGVIISNKNPIAQREVSIDTTLAKGKYYLVINPGAELNPTTGFSKYSCFGYYEIIGFIPNSLKANYDIVLESVQNLSEVCSDHLQIPFTLKNNGQQNITAYYVSVYKNGVLVDSTNYNNPLSAQSSVSYVTPIIRASGNYTIEIKTGLISVTDEIPQNNYHSVFVAFHNGAEFVFSTNHPDYNAINPVSWTIQNTDKNIQVFQGKNVGTITSSNIISQSFCLDTACYSINISGQVYKCSDYNVYSSQSYSGGQTVSYQGGVYQAKWWTLNPPNSNDWNRISNCYDNNFYFKLENKTNSDVLVDLQSNSFSSPFNQSFCFPDKTTAITAVNLSERNSVYPNPFHDELIVNVDGIRFFEMYDITGRLLLNGVVNSNTIYTEELPEGFFVLKLLDAQNNTIQSSKLIKKQL